MIQPVELQKLGKYEIRGVLGRGAMGTVYEAWDPVIARRVAIKTVTIPDADDSGARDEIARFRREAQAAGRLTHPNIVGLFDYGEVEDLAYIVMEFVDGRTMKSVLDAGERFALPDIVRLMGDLLAGLQFSHDHGVVHRDIKPANLILTRKGALKIADFGIARIESSNMTQAGDVLGTPAYMSPEQFKGETVDNRTDIYSCGVVLYQLLTGERPFEGSMTAIMHKALNTTPPAPSELSVTAPGSMDPVVARAIAKRPERRYASVTEFAEAIRAAAGLPERAGTTGDSRPVDDATVVGKAVTSEARPVPSGTVGAGTFKAGTVKARTIPAAPTPSRLPVLAGLAALVLLVLGSGAWFFWPSGSGPVAPQRVAQGPTPAQPPVVQPPVVPAPVLQPPVVPVPVAPTPVTSTPETPPPQVAPLPVIPPPVAPSPITPPQITPPQITSAPAAAPRTIPSPGTQLPVIPAPEAPPPVTAPQVVAPQVLAPQVTPAPVTTQRVTPPPVAPQVLPAPVSPPPVVSPPVTPPRTVAPQEVSPVERQPPARPFATFPPPVEPPAVQIPAERPPIAQNPVTQRPEPASPVVPSPSAPTLQPQAPTGPSSQPRIVELPAPAPTPPSPPPPPSPSPPTVLAMGPNLAALRGSIAAAIAPVPCTLARGDVTSGGGARVLGMTARSQVASLRQAIAAAAPLAALDWRVATFDGPYCHAIDILRPIAKRFGSAAPGLDLMLRNGQTSLQADDYIIFSLAIPEFPALLQIDYLQLDGSVFHLYPGPADPPLVYNAHQRITIGEPKPGFAGWQVTEPFGTEMIIAIASSVPLFAQRRPGSENAEAYLRDLQAALDAARRRDALLAGSATILDTRPRR